MNLTITQGGALSGFPIFGQLLSPKNRGALLYSSQGYQCDNMATIFVG